jgi:hypothetical protein
MADMTAVRARIAAIVLGTYGTEYAIAEGRFHEAAPDSDLEHHALGTLERAFELVMPGDRTPIIPVDRTAGVGYYSYPISIRVGYVYTHAGGEAVTEGGEVSGGATRAQVETRALDDGHRLENALSSWRNTGGLTPHIIDLKSPDGSSGGPTLEKLSDRCILTVPLLLLTREVLGV